MTSRFMSRRQKSFRDSALAYSSAPMRCKLLNYLGFSEDDGQTVGSVPTHMFFRLHDTGEVIGA